MSIKAWIKRNRESAWKLGIAEHGYQDLINDNIKWLDGSKYPNKWFADPFILNYDNRYIFLLVEEFDYKYDKGRIAKLKVDRSAWHIVNCTIILDLPTHLSFPCINRVNGKIYVTPENNAGGGFDLYEYDNKTEKLEKKARLVDKRLTDAVPFSIKGSWYITTTEFPHQNGSSLDIYKSKGLVGPYRKVQTIIFEENLARNAGYPFFYKGKLMRAAQESNYSYGHNLSFQEITVNADGTLAFKEVNRIYKKCGKFTYGTHTYNEYKGVGVIDVKGDRNYIVGRFFHYAHQLLVILHLKKNEMLQ